MQTSTTLRHSAHFIVEKTKTKEYKCLSPGHTVNDGLRLKTHTLTTCSKLLITQSPTASLLNKSHNLTGKGTILVHLSTTLTHIKWVRESINDFLVGTDRKTGNKYNCDA